MKYYTIDELRKIARQIGILNETKLKKTELMHEIMASFQKPRNTKKGRPRKSCDLGDLLSLNNNIYTRQTFMNCAF